MGVWDYGESCKKYEVGLESYMYLEKDEGDFQGHVWDYGDDNGDVISHRIDYEAPGTAPGSILYGNFTVQHDFDAFKEAFFALPEACQSNQVMSCGDETVEQIGRKYFRHSSW